MHVIRTLKSQLPYGKKLRVIRIIHVRIGSVLMFSYSVHINALIIKLK